MTIHDAKCEVTCDEPVCRESIVLDMPARFDRWGNFLGYRLADDEAEKALLKEDWIVRDGKHFCSAFCAKP